MRINLVIEHDFDAAPEAAVFLEAIALAVAKVQRAAKFDAGYHATKPLIKAAAKAEPEAAPEATETVYDDNDNTAPGHEEAKEKRKRRTKAEMDAARAAEAAAGNAAPSAPAPSTPAAQAPAPAPSSPAQPASPSNAPTVDALREALNRVINKKGQAAAAGLMAPFKRVSEIPADKRAEVLANCEAAL